MANRRAHAHETMTHDAAFGDVDKALDAFLRNGDQKEQKANLANSSVVRRERNALRRMPLYVLAREILRRAMEEKRKEDARERKERFKARQQRAERNAD